MSARLKLIDGETSIIDTAFAIAEERENTTQRLARAVLDKDWSAAEKLAKELLPSAESNRTHKSVNRRPSR